MATNNIKPGSSVVVVVDFEWANKPAVNAFLGVAQDMYEVAAVLRGLPIAGVLLDAGDFPGVVIQREATLMGNAFLEWQTFIPWNAILAICSHPAWPMEEFQKQIGFVISGKSDG